MARILTETYALARNLDLDDAYSRLETAFANSLSAASPASMRA